MSRWLVTGAAGMLGRDAVAVLRRGGYDVVAPERTALDVTDRGAVLGAVEEHQPDVVLNTAAFTAVDAAEAREDDALRVNGTGAANVAAACAAVGARLLQVSTDYVFSGSARRPYGEDAEPAPGTAYGRTKLVGERAVLEALPETGYVVRTAWLYGAHGPNFVRTMVRLAAERETVDVVDDQRGQPTWSADLARRLVDLGESRGAPPGVYHATNAGETTWYGLAREVFTLLGTDPDRVHVTTTESLRLPARRPAYSVLGHSRWTAVGLAPLRPWREALQAAFPAL